METENNKRKSNEQGNNIKKNNSNRRKNNKKLVVLIVSVCCLLAAFVAFGITVIVQSVKNDKDSANMNVSDATKSIIGSLDIGKNENNSTEAASAETSSAESENEPSQVLDTEPPVISGVKDRTFNIGDNVIYTSGVSAKDNVDGQVAVTVDKSAVNVKKAGSYKVIYTATDKAGNVARAEAKFTFKETVSSNATYKELSQQILSRIVDSSMTDGQKAKKIYDYLYSKIYYGARKKAGSTWQEEAVLALREIISNGSTKGDCFTSAAVAMAVLETMGAQVQLIQNLGAEVCGSNHVWVLCNVGTGWYHFDITHYANVPDSYKTRFMYTDAQLEEWMNDTEVKRYIWDRSQYPATPTDKFTY